MKNVRHIGHSVNPKLYTVHNEIKATLINILILTINQIAACNVKWVSSPDSPVPPQLYRAFFQLIVLVFTAYCFTVFVHSLVSFISRSSRKPFSVKKALINRLQATRPTLNNRQAKLATAIADEHSGAAQQTSISLWSWWRPETKLKESEYLTFISRVVRNTTPNEWQCCSSVSGCVNKQLFADKFITV